MFLPDLVKLCRFPMLSQGYFRKHEVGYAISLLRPAGSASMFRSELLPCQSSDSPLIPASIYTYMVEEGWLDLGLTTPGSVF